jgi:hypothetical protein
MEEVHSESIFEGQVEGQQGEKKLKEHGIDQYH